MKKTILASAIFLAFSSSSSTFAATIDYTEQTLNSAIVVIGDGNRVTGNNVTINGSSLVSHSSRNEGIYIGNSSSAEFGGDKLEVTFNASDSTYEFAGIQVNGQGDATTAVFSAEKTIIDVNGPVSSGKWGFGLLVNGSGNASARFTGGDVFIKTTTENYTSQSVTVKTGSNLDFSNKGDVQIHAYSPYGITVLDAPGTLNFNNQGNVLLKGEIIPGTSTAQTNVVGIQGWDATWNISEEVKEFRIDLSGAGVDNDGTSYSTGTRGIDAGGEQMSIDINSQNFVINMDIASDVNSDVPEGHTTEKAYGIFIDAKGQLNISQHTNTQISIREGLGTAYGIYAGYGADINLNGNVAIDVNGKTDSYAIFVNGTDIYSDDNPQPSSPTSLTLGGTENHLIGNVVATNQSSLNFENGLTAVKGNVVADLTSSLELKNAGIELSTGSTLKIDGTLTSNNGQIVINEVKENLVSIASLTEGSSLQAVAPSELNDMLGGNLELFSKAFSIGSGAEGTQLLMKEGLITGETSAVLKEDGSVNPDSLVVKRNTLMQSTLELASSAPLALNRIMMNDVRKRLGDIRTTNGTHGTWARYDGGKLSGDGGLENDFHTIQVGIDTVPTPDSARMGVAFSYTDSDAEYARGSADMKAYSLAMYATKMFDNGMFVDVIGRMGTADTDLVVDGEHKGSMNNVALSVSGEMGWRFDLTDMSYIEPQAEVTYTYVNDDKLTLSSAHYDIDAVNSLMGRVGFAAGLKCPDNFGNVYVRASAVHEFLGDSKITGVNGDNLNTYEIDGKDTWVEYGIGANFNVTKSTYVWADVERTTGGALDEDWRATVGVRYAW